MNLHPESRGQDGVPGHGDLAVLGRVAGELLHDLAGRISVLSGNVAMARDVANTGRSPEDTLLRLEMDCQDLRDMVTDAFDELKGRSRSAEVVFPVARATEAVIRRWLAGAPGVTVQLDCTISEETAISGARSFFQRALVNLLQNGVRHAHREVHVALRPEVRGDGRGGVRITVEDDGNGVPEHLVPHLFDPFATADPGGTGLGLSLVAWAASRLGGRATYTGSGTLGGARFELWLPVATETVPAAKPAEPTASDERVADITVLAGIRITVVDDEPAIRRVYRRLLERAGAEVHEVLPGDCSDATEIAMETARSIPDAVLLDFRLGTCSGVDVWRTMRDQWPSVARRTLLLTGAAPEEVRGNGQDGPVVLSKLLGWPNLLREVREIAGV